MMSLLLDAKNSYDVLVNFDVSCVLSLFYKRRKEKHLTFSITYKIVK